MRCKDQYQSPYVEWISVDGKDVLTLSNGFDGEEVPLFTVVP